MGRRGGRGGRGGGRGRGGGGGGGRQQDDRVSFDKLDKTNEKLERYYNTLNIVPAGEEREAFWAALRRELPNSWRFTGSKGHALSVRNNLTERFFPILEKIEHDGKPVDLPTAMPWYPDGLAYSMTTPKNVVRKYLPFKEFQRFLVSETGVGNISRQEQVSMIPPLVLDVKPEHTVLDLCAAPGSKSAQLIELIHAGEEERVEKALKQARGETMDTGDANGSGEDDSGRATGLLVANDVNYRRAQMLVHQVKRLNSPNLIVTNHDATMFPSIELPSAEKGKNKYLKFDRILCDVPCSGDGTCRKNPGIWKDWSPQNGLGLYVTQVRILTRALQMLKVGGRVAYSTCSMNPVENEAVVASAIERCGGVAKVKLVDASDMLPALKRNPGLNDWSIMGKSGQIFESWPEAEQFEDAQNSRITPGMFAPEPEEKIPLEHCLRLYPHQQDTGGFFVAVLEKLSEIKAKPENQSKSQNKKWKFSETEEEKPKGETETADEPSSEEPAANAGEKRKAEETLEPTADGENGTKKAKVEGETTTSTPAAEDKGPGATLQAPRTRRRDDEEAAVESFKYLDPNHSALESIYEFYNLDASFPRDRFLVRNPAGDPVKGIYYTSQLAKDILVANEDRKMKFVHAGVKMFMKQDAQGQDICRWRIQTEGLPIIEGWVANRVIRMWSKKTLRTLLVEMFPRIGRADEEEGQGWRALGEIGEQVRDIGMGCCVVRMEARGGEDGVEEPLTLPLWRSLHSLNLMLPKDERKAMLLRIFDEDVELINHAEQDKEKKAADAAPVQAATEAAEAPAVAAAEATAAEETGAAVSEETKEGATANGA